MQVRVRLGDPLCRVFGTRRLILEFAVAHMTVAGVLARLVEINPAAAADIESDGQSVTQRLPYQLFLNDRKIPWSQLDQAVVRDNDQVALFLIVMGG